MNKVVAVALACAGAVFICAGIKAAGKGEKKVSYNWLELLYKRNPHPYYQLGREAT